MTSKLITASSVRIHIGGVSDMTLWRWLKDQTLNFPRPTYIGARRYWFEAEILDWIEAQPRGKIATAKGGAQ